MPGRCCLPRSSRHPSYRPLWVELLAGRGVDLELVALFPEVGGGDATLVRAPLTHLSMMIRGLHYWNRTQVRGVPFPNRQLDILKRKSV